MGQIIQIACMNENDNTNGAVWALTADGRVYFLILREGVWYEQALPTGPIPVQENK